MGKCARLQAFARGKESLAGGGALLKMGRVVHPALRRFFAPMYLRLSALFLCLVCVTGGYAAVNLGDSFFGGATSADTRGGAPSKDRVIVVANSNDMESVSLARYYCEKREIPYANIIPLPLSTKETISREEFTSTLFNPLLKELIARSWISATPSEEKDPEGRLSPKIVGHKIDFLVLIRGVPLKIARDNFLLELDPNKPAKKEFQVNEASVDSELSCLLMGRYPLTAFVSNPLYNKKIPEAADLQKIVRVARLDGVRADHVSAMIDSALAGEQNGLRGRAYFDIGGPHPKGDAWISQVAELFEKQGFDTTIDREKTLWDISERWDAPAVYLGWYAPNAQGPMMLRDFAFAPGAIAWHIHSFSAKSFRAVDQGWMGAFAQKGAAVSLGNVYEPFLELSHAPGIYFLCLTSGMTHGEAAYAATPALSWMTVEVGDPLYRPFAMALPAQLERVRSWQDRSAYGQYAVIRVMNLLKARGKQDEALLLGRQCFRKSPGLALALELIENLWQQNPKAAGEYLGYFLRATSFSGDDIPVAMTAAEFLAEGRDPTAAVQIFKGLIDSPATPRDAVKAMLPKAIAAARSALLSQEAIRWQTKLTEMTPPPPAPAAVPAASTSAAPVTAKP